MILYIAMGVAFIGGLFSLTRQAQMLQQNSYFPSRYIKWLKGEKCGLTVLSLIYLLVIIACLLLNFGVAALVLSIISTALKISRSKRLQQKSIKKLVYTARVKRQYITLIVLLLIIFVLGITYSKNIFIIGLALSFMPAVSILLVRTINAPIEKMVANYFISDAKRMLKNHTALRVIGVTGSYGKTSTKYILAEILNQKFNCLYTPQSFNTPLGVVRTVRENLKADTGIFITEMGAKNKGDIKEICDIASPDIAVITSVGPQHLDTFKSIENVTATKFELADCVKKKGGKIFLNTDNEYISEKASEYKHTSYGASGDVKYENVTYTKSGAEFDIVADGTTIHIVTKLLGMHNVSNITAAVAVALSLGVSPKDIAFAARRLKPISHRLEMKSFTSGAILLDDAYNANPVGSIEAVNVLGSFDGYTKIIVTPGLVELGEKEYECNYNLGAAAADVADEIILVGKMRAVPLKAAIDDKGFTGKVHIVDSFSEALAIMNLKANDKTVFLIENDLPDNYSK